MTECTRHPEEPVPVHDRIRQLCLFCCLERDVRVRYHPILGWDLIAIPMWLFDTASDGIDWVAVTNAYRSCRCPHTPEELRRLQARMVEVWDGAGPFPCWLIAARRHHHDATA